MNGALAGMEQEFQAGLWRSVGKLFRLRITLFVTGIKRATKRRKAGYIIFAIVIAAVLVGVVALSWGALNLLRSPRLAEVVDPGPLIRSVPVLILTSAFLGLLVTSFGVLLQALYLANDMDFLLAAPVPMRAVFITKLVQAILPNFSLIALLGLPVMYGLGLSAGYWLPYFLFVPLVFLGIALAAAGLASLLVMGIVRIFPARRVAEVLAFVGAISSFVCSQAGQFSNRLDFSTGQVNDATAMLGRLDSPWNPLSWASRGLLGLGEGSWLSGIGQTLFALALGVGIFYLALTMAERLYYTGWARIQVGGRRRRSPKTGAMMFPDQKKSFTLLDGVWRRIPSAIRGLLAKDWLVLRRDLRNMSNLITPLIFGVIYGVLLLGGDDRVPAGRGEAPAVFMDVMQNLVVYANVGLSLFIVWTLQSRLATMGFSQEGKSYWLLKTAPVSSRTLLAAKFTVAFLPSLVLGWTFLALISLLQRSDVGVFIFGLAVVALSSAGAIGINLAFGVVGANLKWEDPRKMTLARVGCLSTLISMVYLPVSAGLFFGPPILAEFFQWPILAGRVAGLIAGGLLGLACAIIPPAMVEKRVSRIGEE